MMRSRRHIVEHSRAVRDEARIAELEGVVREMRKRIEQFCDNASEATNMTTWALACPKCGALYGCTCHDVTQNGT